MGCHRKITEYFSKTEIILWWSSVLLIVLSFCIFDRENYLTLAASLFGVQISADRTEDLASSGLSVSVGTEWLFRTNGPIWA